MTTNSSTRELTLRGMIIGAMITVIFTASNIYLGLKVGMTFSSAIPAAVISMAILSFFKNSSILENTSVQTQASAAGTLSSIIFILPALLMIGYWQSFHFWQTLILCAAGGMLGVVFSVPLRQVMVVNSNLPYPEGIAAAEILKAGCEKDENGKNNRDGLKEILLGSAIAAVLNFCTNGLRLVADGASYFFTKGNAIFQLPIGFSLALFSAGYLVRITSGIAMLIGVIFAWGIVVPIISSSIPHAGQSLNAISSQIWATDIRFIGAGTLAISALWTLIILLKPLIEGLKYSFSSLRGAKQGIKQERTERDLSPKTLLIIAGVSFLVLIGVFYSFVSNSGLPTSISWLLVFSSIIFAFIIGFLIAAACGYMAGLVGSSSSPISGIGIIAIVVISIILLVIGESANLLDSAQHKQFLTALAIFTTSVIIAIATISNDNLQDLKTGQLVKATPQKQQIALIIGCIIGAIVIAPILDLLYQAYGFVGATPRPNMDPSQILHAPQATLMTTIAQGIFSHNLKWDMIIIGLIVGAVVIVIDLILAAKKSTFRIPALAVGMGIYLPPTINIPLIIGAILSWFIFRAAKKRSNNSKEAEKEVDHRATLLASGFIVGESLIGVIVAAVIVVSVNSGGSDAPFSILPYLEGVFGAHTALVTQLLGLIAFCSVVVFFVKRALSALKTLK